MTKGTKEGTRISRKRLHLLVHFRPISRPLLEFTLFGVALDLHCIIDPGCCSPCSRPFQLNITNTNNNMCQMYLFKQMQFFVLPIFPVAMSHRQSRCPSDMPNYFLLSPNLQVLQVPRKRSGKQNKKNSHQNISRSQHVPF